MPHHHDLDLVMRHSLVQRDVIPAQRLPLLVPTSTLMPGAGLPSLVARAPSSDSTGCANGANCDKAPSNLTTTVLPVVLGAGYVFFIFPLGWSGYALGVLSLAKI